MSEGILIRPQEVRNKIAAVREHAKQIESATLAVDNVMNAVGPATFSGRTADAIRRRYAAVRERVASFRPKMEQFALHLENITNTISGADNPES